MKKKLLFIFLAVFVASFLLLNGRFIIANLTFSFSREYTVSNPRTAEDSRNHKPVVSPELFDQLQTGAILVIPKLAVTAPIVFDSAPEHAAVYKALERGVVHYPLTVKPGEAGVAVILGHSSALPWYPGNYGSVFALLGKLKIGDEFSIQYREGLVFDYVIKKTLIFSPFSSEAALNSLVAGRTSSVILVSCWPIDINYKRIAVEAELITN